MVRMLSLMFAMLMPFAVVSMFAGCDGNDSSNGSGSLTGTWVGQEDVATLSGTNTFYEVHSVRMDITQDGSAISGVRRVNGTTSFDFTGTYNETSQKLMTSYALPNGGQAITSYNVSAGHDVLQVVSLSTNGATKAISGTLLRQ